MTELRDLIADRLIGQVTPPQFPWADRVVETHGMDPDTGLPPFGELPWIVVRQVGTTVDQAKVQTHAFEVWIHGPNTSFAYLDELERLAIGLLNSVTLTDTDLPIPRSYTMSYAGTLLGDQVIPAWDAYARGLRFTTSSGGLGGAQAADDPRAQFLRANVANLFCPPVDCAQSDPATWAPTNDCPGVYVRPVGGPFEVIRYSSQTIFRETLAMHVFAATPGGQQAWTDRLALELPGQMDYLQREVLDSNNNRPRISTLLLRVIALNPAADAATEGQLRVECTFSELACDARELAGPLKYVDITPYPTSSLDIPPGAGPDVLLPLDPATVINEPDLAIGGKRSRP